MDAEGAPQPTMMDGSVEQGEVGGMKNAIAERGNDSNRSEAREGIHHRDQRECDAYDRQAGGQYRSRSKAVDGKACRSLRDAGYSVEHAAQDADVSEAQPGAFAHN